MKKHEHIETGNPMKDAATIADRDLALLATYGELTASEQTEFERRLEASETFRARHAEIEELRSDVDVPLAPSTPRPETLNAILAEAGKRKPVAPEQTGVWARVSAFLLPSTQPMWGGWAVAATCATIACLVFLPSGELQSPDTTPKIDVPETYVFVDEEGTQTELDAIELEIATAVDDLELLEQEMGLWLEEGIEFS